MSNKPRTKISAFGDITAETADPFQGHDWLTWNPLLAEILTSCDVFAEMSAFSPHSLGFAQELLPELATEIDLLLADCAGHGYRLLNRNVTQHGVTAFALYGLINEASALANNQCDATNERLHRLQGKISQIKHLALSLDVG